MISLPVNKLPEDRMFLGVYDRWEGTFDQIDVDVEGDYVSWEHSQELNSVINRIRADKRVPLVTIEPFTTTSGIPEQVLQDIVSGVNDAFIAENASIIKGHAPQLVLVRFAHEMELIGNYPWSQEDPGLFIDAYRHYIDFFRKEEVDNVQWVWSPAGNENARPYYPGDGYVDYIGISILGFEDWDRKFGHEQGRSFQSILGDRLWLEEFKKPIVITELGVTPSKMRDESSKLKYQYEWLWLAWESWYYYPSLRGVVYFNAVNADNAWQGERPDWRIQASALPPPHLMPTR